MGLTSLAGTLLTGVVATTSAFAYSPTIEAQFVNDMNAAREQNGLKPYVVASDLVTNARQQSDRMAAKGTIWDDPNVGTEVCCWQSIGENTGMGPDEPSIQSAFMNSPPHRANILDTGFTQVGVGVTIGSNGAVYVTEVFRQPMGSTAPPPTYAPAPPPTYAPAPAPAPVSTASSWSAPTRAPLPAVRPIAPAPTATALLESKIRRATALTRSATPSDPLTAALDYLHVMSLLTR